MPFQKGNTLNARRKDGNKSGRPKKGQSFAEALRAALDQEHRPGMTNRERIALVAIEQAKSGSMEAVKWIADRVDGKVAELPPAPPGPEGLKVDVWQPS